MTSEPDTCVHGGLIDSDGSISCEECDWCSECGEVTAWDGEHCRTCGRTWGESNG